MTRAVVDAILQVTEYNAFQRGYSVGSDSEPSGLSTTILKNSMERLSGISGLYLGMQLIE